jgi:MATE family multidrug resistance protein
MGVALAAVYAAVFLAYGRAISLCFIGDAAVVRTATLLLAVAAVFQAFDGGQVINSAALRGLTDVRVPAAITFVAYWVIALPLGYALGIRGGFGPAGIWSGLAAGLAFAAVLLGVRFLRLTRPGAPSAA